MKQITVLGVGLVLISLAVSHPLWAHGGGGHGGGGFGGHGGGFGGGHYGGGWSHGYGHSGYYGFGLGYGLGYSGGYPYYGGYGGYYGYPPAIVTVPVSPPVYIQQSPPVSQVYPPGYWYYCGNPEGYYPYVKVCPNGWQQVNPVPSPR